MPSSQPTSLRRSSAALGAVAFAGEKPALKLYGTIGLDFSAKDVARALATIGKVPHLDIYANSGGGSVYEGLAIYNMLLRFEGRKRFYIDGVAASMMSVVICAADEVVMPGNTFLMVHLPRLGPNEGGLVADDLREIADQLDSVYEAMLAAYVKKTGKDIEFLRDLAGKETWLTGAEAVEIGFADSLTMPLAAVAYVPLEALSECKLMPGSLIQSQQEPAVAPVAAVLTPAPVAVVDVEAVRAQLQASENIRRTGITTAFGTFAQAHGELLNACLLDSGVTAEQAQARLLAKLGEGATPSAAAPAAAHIHAGNGNLVGDSVRASILARSGLEVIQASNNYNHMSLRELARASLADRGISVAAYSPMQMVGLAFTHSSSDFGNILLDVANKSVLKGWEESEETFEKWVKEGQLGDFKVSRRIGMGEFPSLRQVREGAEYKHITLGDRGEPIALATYGEIFSITRQAIINDDMMMLTDIPRKMGMAAKATIGDLVYAVLTANAAMSDTVALFHATHKNLQTGGPSALAIDSMSKARQAMRTQKTQTEGGAPRTLNIRPAFLLAPIALEDKARQLITSTSVPDAGVNSGITNPIKDFVEVIGEPRLDDASATAWYLAAAKGSDTIEVAYLNGVKVPYVEQQEGFTVDGVASKVRIDAGVAALDFRGMVKSNGA